MTDQETLGGRIRILRAMARMNQGDLGKILDKSRSTMSLIETGDQEPTGSQLQLLANVFAERLGWSQGRVLLYLFGMAGLEPRSEAEGFSQTSNEAGSQTDPSQMLRDGKPVAA